MTTKTRHVSIHPRRDRERHTAATATMTSRTTRAQRRVFPVIEFDVETLQRRKSLNLPALRVGVTNRADRISFIRKLLLVTTRTRRVSGFARQRWLR